MNFCCNSISDYSLHCDQLNVVLLWHDPSHCLPFAAEPSWLLLECSGWQCCFSIIHWVILALSENFPLPTILLFSALVIFTVGHCHNEIFLLKSSWALQTVICMHLCDRRRLGGWSTVAAVKFACVKSTCSQCRCIPVHCWQCRTASVVYFISRLVLEMCNA